MISIRRPRRSSKADETRDDSHPQTSTYEGWLQGVGNGQALGWCWEPASPDRHVQIAIAVDGEIVAEGPADIARSDLAERGNGTHGFVIGLPDSLQAPGRRRLIALAGPEKVPIETAPSFWHEANSGNGWSDVVFEPGEPRPDDVRSATVPQPPVYPERRAVIDAGWLFDAREFEPKPANLEAIVTNLTATAATCAALGISYLPVLVPAKRHLVRVGARGNRGWVSSLNARLRDVDEVELMNLLPVLRQATRHGALYNRTDADWNDLGSFFVARALLKEAHKQIPALRPPALADLHLSQIPDYRGTLADAPKLELVDGDLTPCTVAVEAENGLTINASRLHALRMPVGLPLAQAESTHLRVYENPECEEDARLAVVGGTAASNLVLWLAERTRRTTFFWSDALPLAQLELELPPIVIHLIRETDLLTSEPRLVSREPVSDSSGSHEGDVPDVVAPGDRTGVEAT